MHGNEVAVYLMGDEPQRFLLDDTMNQGNALATADLLGLGRDQIIAGWRNSDENDRVGIKLFVPVDETGTQWETYLIDDNTMATEDLIIPDLDGDGRPEIIAAGRATNNLIIYWNGTGDEERQQWIRGQYTSLAHSAAGVNIVRERGNIKQNNQLCSQSGLQHSHFHPNHQKLYKNHPYLLLNLSLQYWFALKSVQACFVYSCFSTKRCSCR